MTPERIEFIVDGTPSVLDAPPEMPLLWALRHGLGHTGPKFGCGMALCGACTVFVDGKSIRACVTPVGSVAGQVVTTIEGLDDPVGAAVQTAWAEGSVPQCGYCQAGQVMGAVALLRTTRRPTDAQIDDAMRGHLCRCGAYPRIRAAIHAAAERLATSGSDD
ncbi:MAG: hypothetical protein RL340_402 [Gemmatimonadota bacterium]|jgi:isoquinoline 1-oxidoreductase alpha subunit